MSGRKDAAHLYRFAGLFVLAFLVFLAARHYVVPKSFGEYGHYRGAAMGEIAAHPAKFAGHAACESCHSDVQAVKMKGMHAHVNCEACHGALIERLPQPAQPAPNVYQRFIAMIAPSINTDSPFIRHADDPTSVIPQLPDTAVLCVRCHTASAAKPKWFPQIVPAEHYAGVACGSCHNPHSPAMNAGGAK